MLDRIAQVPDALTNGGLGGLFAPFDSSRYVFAISPVAVSRIRVREFFSDDGLQVLASEATWIWLPSFAVWRGLRAATYPWSARRSLTDYPR